VTPVRVLRELKPDPTTGTAVCLVLAGGRHYRLQTLVCAEYPDIKQTLVFASDPRGWPLEWGRGLCLNGMDREEALAEVARRTAAARARRAERRSAEVA
jgi:hypothetical protein